MVVGQIPHGIIIQKIAPRIWLPSMVVVWAGLTVSTGYATCASLPLMQVITEVVSYE
jgi:ACS family pantothenate transporter-like MFS transporter